MDKGKSLQKVVDWLVGEARRMPNVVHVHNFTRGARLSVRVIGNRMEASVSREGIEPSEKELEIFARALDVPPGAERSPMTKIGMRWGVMWVWCPESKRQKMPRTLFEMGSEQ